MRGKADERGICIRLCNREERQEEENRKELRFHVHLSCFKFKLSGGEGSLGPCSVSSQPKNLRDRGLRGVDFLTKPVDEEALLASVERALRQDRANRQEALEHARLVARYESLTPREREVLPLLINGLLNKQVAFELGIAEYTVQIHRGHIMRKMEADSFATLVKLAGRLKIETASASSRNT